MQWMSDEEYSNLTGLDISAINDLCERGKLSVKVEDGVRYIDPSKGAGEVVPAQLSELSRRNTHEMIVQPEFVEKTMLTNVEWMAELLATRFSKENVKKGGEDYENLKHNFPSLFDAQIVG